MIEIEDNYFTNDYDQEDKNGETFESLIEQKTALELDDNLEKNPPRQEELKDNSSKTLHQENKIINRPDLSMYENEDDIPF